ncbi:hypothetical protein [Nonomuraea fuscirosea]|uniref:hypothetical protein n=1 Tax=Nonomuraea fuscirosea TaxID=1291556 RepID=UPI0033DB7C95
MVLAAVVLLIAGFVLAKPFLIMWSIVVSVLSALFLVIGAFLRRNELFPGGGQAAAPATPPKGLMPPAPPYNQTGPTAHQPPMRPQPHPRPQPQAPQRTATVPAPAMRRPAAGGVAPDAIVLVIPGRKRYHVPGCRQLTGRDHEELTYEEAREEGFTPCTACLPDAALGGRQLPPAADPEPVVAPGSAPVKDVTASRAENSAETRDLRPPVTPPKPDTKASTPDPEPAAAHEDGAPGWFGRPSADSTDSPSAAPEPGSAAAQAETSYFRPPPFVQRAEGTSAAGKPTSGKPSSGRPAPATPASGGPSSGASAPGSPSSGRPSSGTSASGRPSSGTPTSGRPSSGTPGKPSSGTGAASPAAGAGVSGTPAPGKPSTGDTSPGDDGTPSKSQTGAGKPGQPATGTTQRPGSSPEPSGPGSGATPGQPAGADSQGGQTGEPASRTVGSDAKGGRPSATPGQSGGKAGQSATTQGQAGKPGQPSTTPGQSVSKSGQSGSTPGQSGGKPGQSTGKTGRPGDADDRDDDGPGPATAPQPRITISPASGRTDTGSTGAGVKPSQRPSGSPEQGPSQGETVILHERPASSSESQAKPKGPLPPGTPARPTGTTPAAAPGKAENDDPKAATGKGETPRADGGPATQGDTPATKGGPAASAPRPPASDASTKPPASGAKNETAPGSGKPPSGSGGSERQGVVKVIVGTRRYHSTACPLVRGAGDTGVETMTLAAAEAAGLTSCSVCQHDRQTVS